MSRAMALTSAIHAMICARELELERRREVEAWITKQSALGNLVRNSDAPAWHFYEAAVTSWQRAIAQLDRALGAE